MGTHFSEKVYFKKEIEKVKIHNPDKMLVFGEDMFDCKIRVYRKWTADIRSKAGDVEVALLIYFKGYEAGDLNKEKVNIDVVNSTLYISESKFLQIWPLLKPSINLGMMQNKNMLPKGVKEAEDILDLSLMNSKGTYAVFREGKIIASQKSPEEEKKEMIDNKQRLLSNPATLFVYDAKRMMLHDKECEKVAQIAPKDFRVADSFMHMKECSMCKRRMYLRKACYPRVKDISACGQMFVRKGISTSDIRKYVVDWNLSIRANGNDEMFVTGTEDTFLIKGFAETAEEYELWHNNYVKTSETDRYISSDFHNQNFYSENLTKVMAYIKNYTYEGHLENEAKMAKDTGYFTKRMMKKAAAGSYFGPYGDDDGYGSIYVRMLDGEYRDISVVVTVLQSENDFKVNSEYGITDISAKYDDNSQGMYSYEQLHNLLEAIKKAEAELEKAGVPFTKGYVKHI